MAEQRKVKRIPGDDLRVRWRELRDAAQFEGWSFLVSYNDSPVPVVALLPPRVWEEGRERIAAKVAELSAGEREGRPELVGLAEAETVALSARESRPALARLVRGARSSGVHTTVTNRGEPTAVLVPFAWVREALPDLAEGSPVDGAGRDR